MFLKCLALFLLLNLGAYALEDTYFKGEKLDIPYREQAVIVTKDGFYPNRLVVYKGEKVRFFVTAIGETSACFNIPSKNVFATAHQGKLAEAEAFFENSGTYQFNCPNFQGAGRIMVIEKAADKEETLRRGLASDVIKVWQPKELPTEWVQIKRDELKSLRGMSDVMDLDTSEGK
jgi:plastocyanin